jgi:hypothetical protein
MVRLRAVVTATHRRAGPERGVAVIRERVAGIESVDGLRGEKVIGQMAKRLPRSAATVCPFSLEHFELTWSVVAVMKGGPGFAVEAAEDGL